MIFNTEATQETNWDAVEPSKYEVGLEGALMHVYETECNYNALMKAAGLSELKYFKETGGDLFVNEAGAMKGFLEKAKNLFMAVIHKIQAMFKRFFMMISSYVMEDSKFVKKYRAEIMKRNNLKDFEFKGYDFSGLDDKIASMKNAAANQSIPDGSKFDDTKSVDLEDKIDNFIKLHRGKFVSGTDLDESEFRKALHEKLYGDGKDTLTNINLGNQLDIISNTKPNIRSATDVEKKYTDDIKKYVKALETLDKQVDTDRGKDGADTDALNHKSKIIRQKIDMWKGYSQNYVTATGVIVQALKDRNRQAKAICVKAMGYKNKDTNTKKGFEESAGVDDIFADVVIQ